MLALGRLVCVLALVSCGGRLGPLETTGEPLPPECIPPPECAYLADCGPFDGRTECEPFLPCEALDGSEWHMSDTGWIHQRTTYGQNSATVSMVCSVNWEGKRIDR